MTKTLMGHLETKMAAGPQWLPKGPIRASHSGSRTAAAGSFSSTSCQSWKLNHGESDGKPGRIMKEALSEEGECGPTRVTCDNFMSGLKTVICILIAFIYSCPEYPESLS